MVDLVPLSKGQFIRLPWLPQRGELSAKLTERGNGKASVDGTPLRPLRATSPQGARQGKLRRVSQGKGDLGEQKVNQWNWVQRHAAWTHVRIGRERLIKTSVPR